MEKRSDTIIYQPKTIENPNIVDIKSDIKSENLIYIIQDYKAGWKGFLSSHWKKF